MNNTLIYEIKILIHIKIYSKIILIFVLLQKKGQRKGSVWKYIILKGHNLPLDYDHSLSKRLIYYFIILLLPLNDC